MSGPFRQEALHHASERVYGSVIGRRPVSLRVLTALFSGCSIALLAFFFVFSYARKVHLQGSLVPVGGAVRVGSNHAGVVIQRMAMEGRSVRAGDTLFVLSDERSSPTDADVERKIQSLLAERQSSLGEDRDVQARQAQMRIRAVDERLRALATDEQRLGEQIDLQRQRIKLAEEATKQYEDLRNQNFVSYAQVRDREVDLLAQRERAVELGRSVAANRQQQATARAEMADALAEASRNLQATARAQSTVQQDIAESEARRRIAVRAEQDGVVTAVTAELGQSVGAGQDLATILPAGAPLEAELRAPSSAIGFLHAGLPVTLRYRAFPYQRFGQATGVIREVSAATFPRRSGGDFDAFAGVAEPAAYRILVRLDRQTVHGSGIENALKAGMALDATVLLESHRLYQWALEPLFSLSGRLQQ